tara:strand:- start:248 stop:748 length:501 start_codon:yes stop_codon:yes gene_type:complete
MVMDGKVPGYLEVAEERHAQMSTCEWWIWFAIIVLYLSVTILDLVRGVVHSFLYDAGLNSISGLATGDALCDSRLSVLMIGYGGANLEHFLVRCYILFIYAMHNRGLCFVSVSSLASALWLLATCIGASMGDIDIGDADVPGKTAMLVRTIVSAITFVLTLFLYLR